MIRILVTRQANINGLAAHLSSVFKHRFRFGSEHPYHHRFVRFVHVAFSEIIWLC